MAARSNDDSLPRGVYQETFLRVPERRAAARGVALGIKVTFSGDSFTEEGAWSCQPRSYRSVPAMHVGELLASITEHRRRSAQQSDEEGAQIKRRLQDLLAVPSPTQEVETPFSHARIENDPACLHGRQESSRSRSGEAWPMQRCRPSTTLRAGVARLRRLAGRVNRLG